MSTITTQHQQNLAEFLCARIGYMPTANLRCIGSISEDGQSLLGVVGYDGFNGASVTMHVAAATTAWISKRMLHAAFDYPFNVMGCAVVLGMVPSGNTEALAMNKRLGFEVLLEVPDAHPDGSLILMALRRENCKWLAPRRTH